MTKAAYILNYFGKPVAVILVENETELEPKLKIAIQEEACAEKDAQFSLDTPRMGDWGETVSLKTSYVNDGSLVEDNEFSLTKTVSY